VEKGKKKKKAPLMFPLPRHRDLLIAQEEKKGRRTQYFPSLRPERERKGRGKKTAPFHSLPPRSRTVKKENLSLYSFEREKEKIKKKRSTRPISVELVRKEKMRLFLIKRKKGSYRTFFLVLDEKGRGTDVGVDLRGQKKKKKREKEEETAVGVDPSTSASTR